MERRQRHGEMQPNALLPATLSWKRVVVFEKGEHTEVCDDTCCEQRSPMPEGAVLIAEATWIRLATR